MTGNYEPTYNDYMVFFAGSVTVFHAGSGGHSFWSKTRCGISHWLKVPYRLLDASRVRPCKRCYP